MDNNNISNIDELKKTLKNGDIIAFEGTSCGSWFIRIFTISKFSHVAIVRCENDNAFIYEYPDISSKIKKSNILDRINDDHVKSVTILKPNREIKETQLNELDYNFSTRVSLNSKYSMFKAAESGLTKSMVFLSFVFLLVSLVIQIVNFSFFDGRLSPLWTIIGYVPIVFLIYLIYFKPKKFRQWLEKSQKNKIGYDFCSGYVVEADYILGGELYKHTFLESNLTPKNIVKKAEKIGYEKITYIKNNS